MYTKGDKGISKSFRILRGLYQLLFIMPQKIINYTMVNAELEIKE